MVVSRLTDKDQPLSRSAALAAWRASGRPAQLLSRMAHVATGESMGPAMLERVIATEPSIAVRALSRLALGAYAEPLAAFPTITDAIRACGPAPVCDAFLAVGVEDLAAQTLTPIGLDGRAFVRHSVAVAAASRWLAGRSGVDGGSAFVAGLLHDVGILILAHTFPEIYRGARVALAGGGTPLHAFETHHLGYDHGLVASGALAEAGFSEAIVRAAARHHEVGGPAIEAIVQACDIVVLQVGGDVGFGIVPPDLPNETATAAKLKDDDFSALAEVVTTAISRVDRCLG